MGFFNSLFGGKQTPEEKQEKTNKKNFDILKYDGIRAMRIGKLTYAIKCFEEALTIQEDVETMQHQTNAYMRVNRMEDACRLLTRITELEADQPQHFQMLANLHYMMEDYANMNKACEKAIMLDNQNPANYFLSAKAFLGNHDSLQAIAMLTKAIMLDENFIEAYQMRAEVLWALRQVKEATSDVEKLLELNPEDESAMLLKAEMLAAIHKKEEALMLIDQILSLNPFNENAYLLKGSIYAEDIELEKAISVYDDAIEINPQFAKAYYERGRIKLQKGDKDGSLEDMKKAMELAPENGVNISGEYNNYEEQKNIPF